MRILLIHSSNSFPFKKTGRPITALSGLSKKFFLRKASRIIMPPTSRETPARTARLANLSCEADDHLYEQH